MANRYDAPSTEDEMAQFKRSVDARKIVGRTFDPILECISCKFSTRESNAKAQGLTACPNCGSNGIKVKILDYNEEIRDNPLPTVKEAEESSKRVSPHGGA